MSGSAPDVGFQPGDPVPWFIAETDQIPEFQFSTAAGRYVLLAFLVSTTAPGAAGAWNAIRAAQAEGLLQSSFATALLVTTDPNDGSNAPGKPARLHDEPPGIRVLRDHKSVVSAAFGAAAAGVSLLLDPMLRVIAARPVAATEDLVQLLRTLPPPALHGGQQNKEAPPAPVLVLPRVLEPELCQSLIAYYQTHGGIDSGFMQDTAGRSVTLLDADHKRRRDCAIADPTLVASLSQRIGGRLVPEIYKAFQFHVTQIERFMVACYAAADGGHFRPHRDNTTKATAHRRFAVSINLNDDFDGGDLVFPEFGPQRYRPTPGGAIVFSCGLLHEVARVSRGVRYATLPFLHDDAAERIRQENLRFVG